MPVSKLIYTSFKKVTMNKVVKNSNHACPVCRNPLASRFWGRVVFSGSIFFWVIGSFLTISPANAADVTVTNGQTVGQQALGNGDTLTVDQGGTVSVSGAAQSAVTDTVGGTITVNNSGTISATGAGASQGVSGGGATLNVTNNGTGTITATDGGVTAVTLQSLTNSGTITGGVEGVRATTIQSLTNSGTVTGTTGDGLQATTMTSITNSGTITGGDDGIEAPNLTSLTNSGTITGSDNGVVTANTIQNLTNNGTITGTGTNGIVAGALGTVTNNGTITGGSSGVESGSLQKLTNNGTITGATEAVDIDFGAVVNSGTIQGTVGVQVDRDTAGNASITNSGTIRSTSGPAGIAIDFQGAGNDSLTLSGKSTIVGAINLGAGTDTLNFRSGRSSTLTFDSAPEVITTSNTGPVFSNGSQVAVLDATALSLADDNMAILTNRLGTIISQQANRSLFPEQSARMAAQQTRKVLLASAGDPVSLPSPNQKKYRTWVDGFGGYNDRDNDGSILGAQTYFAGGIIGIDTVTSRDDRLGLFFGGAHTNVDVDFNSENDNIDSYFGGVYAGRHLGRN